MPCWRRLPAAEVEAALGRFAADAGPPPLGNAAGGDRPHLRRRYRRGDRRGARAEGGDWAAETRKAVAQKSPTSLKIFLRQMAVGRGFDLDAALVLEYRLSQHMLAAHDFYEGVRAAIIDRDHRPLWQPATLAEVDEALGRALFRSARRR